MTQSFDFNKALTELQSDKGLTGEDGVLTSLIKQLTEAALKAELEQHLESAPQPNCKNGTIKKTVKSSVGQFELETPIERSGSFEPQLVKNNQTKLTAEIDQKILSMFALGICYRDIRSHVQQMYGIGISKTTITGVTDKIIPELKPWQCRSLDTLYPFIWLDAIHYKVNESGRYVSKAVCILLGINIEGRRDLLGLYASVSEDANY